MTLVLRWGVGGVLIAMGLGTACMNISRHWTMSRIRKTGGSQNISGVGCGGSLLFFLGWLISPLEFTPWSLLFLLQEIPAQVTYVTDEETLAPDGPDPRPEVSSSEGS